jgi:Polyketide cyclase / dehydrase and lipid transport
MWTHEHTVETAVAPEAIWKVLRDLDNWPRWDTSMEQVSIQGPFAVGTRVSMTPKGQDPIVSVITGIRENEFYADETDLGDVTLHFSHTLTRLAAAGTRVTHRLEITGPAADEAGPQMGAAIVADFPEAMDALLAYASA